MGIVLAILLFGFIVFFHELGHFLLARINGINVYEFWIGMGPTLAHKKIGNTDYCLKILPIGGACVMGEDEKEDLEASTANRRGAGSRSLPQVRYLTLFLPLLVHSLLSALSV